VHYVRRRSGELQTVRLGRQEVLSLAVAPYRRAQRDRPGWREFQTPRRDADGKAGINVKNDLRSLNA